MNRGTRALELKNTVLIFKAVNPCVLEIRKTKF